MTKGRQFVPSIASDGTWFQHRRAPTSTPMSRGTSTSTGDMLTAPFKEHIPSKPMTPPSPFKVKEDMNYKLTNRFSDHNNRHVFQDHGVYFGDGKTSRLLGRKLMPINTRLHYTEPDFLKHYSVRPVDSDFNTLYTESYYSQTTEQPGHRRFPKNYAEPQIGPIKLDTTTTDCFKLPDVPFRTPTHVLAVSQEPFLKHNRWKYSYNSLKNVYPPYERKNEPVVDNTFNRYGAAFSAGSA